MEILEIGKSARPKFETSLLVTSRGLVEEKLQWLLITVSAQEKH